MKLVSSYLNEVGRFLPEDQRNEILEELRGDIEEEVIERAQESSRDPILEDESAVLQRFGHPLKVAGRYQPARYLIGPELFPAFIQTLKTAVVVVLCLQVFAALVLGQSEGWQFGPGALLKKTVEITFWVVMSIVATFAILEYSGDQLNWYENWQPKALGENTLGVIDRSTLVTNLVVEGLFLLWWNDLLVLQNWIPFVGEPFPLELSQVWEVFFWPANVIFGICLVLHAAVLVRGVWTKKTLALELATCVAILFMAVSLLTAGDLLSVSESIAEELRYNLQRSARGALAVVAVIVAWDLWTAIKLFRGSTSGSP